MDIIDYIPNLAKMINSYKSVVSENYFNSSVVLSYPHVSLKNNFSIKIDFGLDDVIAASAIAGNPIAIIGSTGSGKSYLADTMAHCLFGTEYGEKTINPNINQMDFVDPAYRKMLESENKSEYINPDPLLSKPCIILNELNRTPSILQNFFLAMLEKKVNLYGINFDVGIKSGNKHYCFTMATLNEGAEYSGISNVDLALRNRFGVELFIDNYNYNDNGGLTKDLINMLGQKPNRQLILAQKGFKNMIINISNSLESIPLNIESYLFLECLNWSDKCSKSYTKSKRAVPIPQLAKLCNGCEYAKDHNDFCRNFYQPSKRAFTSLVSFSKALSLMKHAKLMNYCQDKNIECDFDASQLEVKLDDLLVAAPFVLAGKTEMNPKWVNDYYQGNKVYACQDIGNYFKKEIIEASELFPLLKNTDPVSMSRVEAFKKKRMGPDMIDFMEKFIEDE